MATTKTSIINLALVRIGAETIDSYGDDNNRANTANVLYDQTRDEMQVAGPELGWKFLRVRKNGVDVDSHSITAFADYSGTAAGAVKATAASHGLTTGDMVTISGTTNYNGDFVVTVIDTISFYFTDTWVANDATGTVAWTSQEYKYRYAIPSSPVCLRLVSVQVGGTELTDWVREGDYILTNEEDEEVDVLYVKQQTTESLFPTHFITVFKTALAAQLAYALSKDDNLHDRIINDLDLRIMPKAMAMDEREKYVQEESHSWTEIGRTTTTIT